MTDAHERMLDDVAVYALGALPAAEARRVRDHLAACEACRDEYAQLAPAAAAVGGSAALDAPSPLLKARIMREVRAVPKPRRLLSGAWTSYLLAAACLAFAVSVGLINLSLTHQLRDAKEYAATLERQATTASHSMAEEERTLADITSESARRYNVANGQIVRVGDRIYLAMHDLPTLPPGKVYQAWTLPRGGKVMVPAPTFTPDEHGAVLLTLPVDAGKTAAVAVSVEPEGGSKEPTSKPLVVQALD
jgi:anti-sigma-K factor RskA